MKYMHRILELKEFDSEGPTEVTRWVFDKDMKTVTPSMPLEDDKSLSRKRAVWENHAQSLRLCNLFVSTVHFFAAYKSILT